MPLTRVEGTLSNVERASIEKYRREVLQHTDEQIETQSHEEFMCEHLNQQLSVMVKNYKEAALPALMDRGEKFLNAPPDVQAKVDALLNGEEQP